MKLLRTVICTLICFILFSPIINAQTFDASNVTLDDRWAYGPSYGVEVLTTWDHGGGAQDYVFMGNGGYLVWYEVSTPTAPVEVAKVGIMEPLWAIAVEVFSATEAYIYLADDASGLRIIKATWAAGPVYTLAEVGSYDTQGQAFDVTLGQFADLYSVKFYDSSTGWTVGSTGRILGTTDGGTIWNHETSETDNLLNSVYFYGNNYGWAVGNAPAAGTPTILNTTDAGGTWTAQTPPATLGATDHLNGVFFFNNNTGWAVGDNGTIIKTIDGGYNWTDYSVGGGHLRDVHFISATNGWVVGAGGRILNSANGGLTWPTDQSLSVADQLEDIFFLGDNLNGWIVGDNGLITFTTDAAVADLWDSNDFYDGTGTHLWGVHFTDANNGWAVGNAGNVLMTTTGGINDPAWSDQQVGSNRLRSVYFTSATNGWAVGDNGTFLMTSDGTSWTYRYGQYAYVADGRIPGTLTSNNALVFDVTDKTNPRLVGFYPAGGEARSVAYYNNHLYVSYIDNPGAAEPEQISNNALRALDVLDPNNVRQEAIISGADASWGNTAKPYDIALDPTNNYVYVADNAAFRAFAVSTNLGDPIDVAGTPGFTLGGTFSTNIDNARGVYYVNTEQYAYVADGNNKLHSIDVTTTPGTPTAGGMDATDGASRSVAHDATNNFTYTTLGPDGFQVNTDVVGLVDQFSDVPVMIGDGVALPRAPTEGGYTRDVAVSGTDAFIADTDDGVRKINLAVSPPEQSAILKVPHFDETTETPVGITVSNNLVYVAASHAGLKILKTADLTLDGANSHIETDGQATGIAVSGNFAYVADGPGVDQRGALRIIDLDATSGTFRTIIGNYADFTNGGTSGTAGDHNALDVVVRGNRAFVAVDKQGLWIIDVTTKTAPAYITHVVMAGDVYAVDVDVLGRYAYVADGADGLRIVDVDPTSPTYQQIWNYDLGDFSARDVSVVGNYAYVAYGTHGLRVVNISNPQLPTPAGHLNTGDDAYAVAVQGENVYIADNEDGLFATTNDLVALTYYTLANEATYGGTFVQPTGKSMPLVIKTILLQGSDTIQPGDEIGIFDGDLLVGRATYTGSEVTEIDVWLKYIDPYTGFEFPGATPGHNMIYRVYNKSLAVEISAYATYLTGDGRFTETQLITVVDVLTAWQLNHFNDILPPHRSTGQWQKITIRDNIKINRVPISVGDEIAVYDHEVGRLVGAAAYASDVVIYAWLEASLPHVTLAGAIRGNTIEFRIWDTSATIEYLARPTYDDSTTSKTFGNNDLIVILLEAFTDMTQTITISQNKLNLISFNVDPVDAADKQISSMLDHVDHIQVTQNDLGQYYLPGRSPVVDQIGVVDLYRGYQVYYKYPAGAGVEPVTQDIINEGFELVPEDGTIDLNQSVRMIGNPYQVAYYASQVFADIEANQQLVVLWDDDGNVWIPKYNFGGAVDVNTIDDDGDADPTNDGLRPGKGYKIYINTPRTFTYPAPASLTAVSKQRPALAKEKTERLSKEFAHFTVQKTGLAYPIIITDARASLEEGDEIGLFTGDLCVGAGTFNGNYPAVVVAWESFKVDDYEAPGFTKGDPIMVRVWRITDRREYDIPIVTQEDKVPVFGEGPMLTFGLGDIQGLEVLPTTFELDQNFPNPFNPETSIPYQLPEESRVRIMIYNTMGQIIRALIDETKEAGRHTVTWDGRNEQGLRVSSGVYFVRMKAGDYTKIQKMTLIQ